MDHKFGRVKQHRSFSMALVGGILFAALFGVLVLLLFSMIAYRTENPTALVVPMGLTALGLSGVLCGWLCSKFWGYPSMVPALVGGAIFAVLITASGLCIPGTTLSVGVRCVGCPAIFICAVLGGVLAQKRNKRRRHR